VSRVTLKNYDAVAFDVEGTLADTIPIHHAARLDAFKAHGFGHITREQHELGPTYGSYPVDIIGGVLHAAGEIEKLEPFKNNPIVQAIIATKSKLFEELAKGGFNEMPGAADFVRNVATAFAGRIALVTSSPERFVIPFLGRYDLVQYFPDELIVNDDTIQAEGLAGKPAPDAYLLAMRRLKCINMLVFEDTVSGVASAKRAGATVVALGFNQQSAKLFESGELEYPPDLFARNYDEARTLLEMS
jgi:beta-phosphoglucomutase-like phosphatase (HAD superfamily)